ncbi:A/G-specific adenine glycosylase [Faecalispora anaeroviscerum]|uniref:A/G-specific adenine glycosylase n=1 Tax=Faecalispora anaeroviscerum TaxID=2991836 RepID=UPI0024BAF551|nr:A/G-specific adenine glycosylase [Faecalispora anaeroviscerum]
MTASLDLHKIVPPLLSWYDKAARVLPWRENPQPYRVWVSEIMLQQTRVEAVKPYYERFLSALPTVETLADAPEELLLKLWEGLGYYNRVRNLQRAARVIAEQHGGQVPASFDKLLALPGFGEYTAGAVASIAFGIRVPAVDGNVLRVISRLTADRRDSKDAAVKRQVTEAVRGILPERVGDFNQSLMELGATVCLPNGAPLCAECPLNGLCAGYRQGIAAELPAKTAKRPRVIEERTVFLLCTEDRVALRRRPARGLLAGLWELPGISGTLSAEQAEEQLREWGLLESSVQPLPRAKHIFTHREWRMTAYAVRAPQPFGEFVWVTRQELLEEYMLPSAFKTYADMLKDWISVDI